MLYLMADLGFAGCYYRLYLRDQHRFLFARDIAGTQHAARRLSLTAKLARIQAQSNALQALLRALPAKDAGLEFRTWPSLPSAAAYEELRGPTGSVRFGDSPFSDCRKRDRFPCPPWGTVAILDEHDSVLATIDVDVAALPRPTSTATAREAAAALLAQVRERIQQLAVELADPEALYQSSWGFLDFLYFSTITQMTVGYGDIVPNSVAVRAFVMVQLVVSGALLLIVLNLGLNRSSRNTPSS